jgi:hypothetical protein
MDQAPAEQQVPPQPTIPPKRLSKGRKFLLGLLFLIVILVLTTGAYYAGVTRNSLVHYNGIPSPTAPLLTETPASTPDSQNNTTTTVIDNSVSLIYENATPYLRYRDTIYTDDDEKSYTPGASKSDNIAGVPWIHLVDAPANIIKKNNQNNPFDEVFSLKTIPGTRSFVFVMRYTLANGLDNTQTSLPAYYYNFTDKKLTELLLTKTLYPKIYTFSNDGNYVAFRMFQCWNCGGHTPSTEVVNLKTNTAKNIGRTSYFIWKDNGMYEYKEYIPEECNPPEPGPVECSQDPATLPLKSGSL